MAAIAEGEDEVALLAEISVLERELGRLREKQIGVASNGHPRDPVDQFHIEESKLTEALDCKRAALELLKRSVPAKSAAKR